MSQGRYITSTREQITAAAVRECGGYRVLPGTLLMSFKLTLGKLAFARCSMYTNEAIAALPIRDPKRVHDGYLYHALANLDLNGKSDRAVLGATLNKAKLAELQIPLPTYSEQQRIAAILDMARGVYQKRENAKQLAEDLLRAFFYEKCGDPVANPLRWPEKPLSDVGVIMTGNTPPREVGANYGDAIEWVKSDNINTAAHVLTRAREGLSDLGASIGRIVPAGSTLMTCIAGSAHVIGNVALADRRVAFNQQINAITPHPGTDPHFLYTLLLFSKTRIQAASTNSMKGMVSKGMLEKVKLVWPTSDIQNEVAAFFRKVMQLHDRMEAANPAALLQALQHRFLT